MSVDQDDHPRAGTLHHVELCTSDLKRSIAFWEWLLFELEYELKAEWENGRSWINLYSGACPRIRLSSSGTGKTVRSASLRSTKINDRT